MSNVLSDITNNTKNTLLTLPSLVFALPEANVTVFPPTESITILEFRPIAQYDHDNTWINKAFNTSNFGIKLYITEER